MECTRELYKRMHIKPKKIILNFLGAQNLKEYYNFTIIVIFFSARHVAFILNNILKIEKGEYSIFQTLKINKVNAHHHRHRQITVIMR